MFQKIVNALRTMGSRERIDSSVYGSAMEDTSWKRLKHIQEGNFEIYVSESGFEVLKFD
jgi:hypothetical protein